MTDNFTPLDINKIRNSYSVFNTVLLMMATITTLVLVVLLFLLIQKKMKETSITQPKYTAPTIIPSPTPVGLPSPAITQTASESAVLGEPPVIITSQSGQLQLFPTNTATKSFMQK